MQSESVLAREEEEKEEEVEEEELFHNLNC